MYISSNKSKEIIVLLKNLKEIMLNHNTWEKYNENNHFWRKLVKISIFFSFPEIKFIKPLFRRIIIQNTKSICSLLLTLNQHILKKIRFSHFLQFSNQLLSFPYIIYKSNDINKTISVKIDDCPDFTRRIRFICWLYFDNNSMPEELISSSQFPEKIAKFQQIIFF